ncbi:MAG: hypothetical protein IJB84_02910 [Lachnospiraceae bacterium]|nr:hypothetical protein [Lachnospiraceae bacterium]
MFNIRDYGAVGDGIQLDSPAIQAAVDACAAAGGGTVFVPAGKYLCGTVHLKSHIHILIEKGAYLLGSTNLADFDPREENPANCEYQDPSHSYYHFSLFHADNQEDIAITGFGEIDMQSVWDGDGRPDENGNRKWWRGAKIIAFKECREIVIRDLSMKNATDLAVYVAGCEYVTISGLQIVSHIDGVSPDCCRNVTISDCIIDSADDAIVPKCSYTLGYLKAMENLTISNCVLRSNAAALKFGTETNSAFKNITVTGCTICDTQLNGIAIQSADGAIVEGITISNMTLRNVGNPILIQVVNRARGPKPECEKIGQIRNIILSDIIITGPYPETFQATRAQFAWTHIDQDLTLKGIRHPLLIAGQPDSPIQNVTMSNVVFRAHGGGTVEDRDIQLKEVRDDYPGSTVFGNKFPTYGLYALNADNLKLYNVEFTTEYPDARDEMILKNVTNFKRV